MRGADIQVGGEYACSTYGGLRKIRIIEKGVPRSKWTDRADGVRFEVVDGPPLREGVRPLAQTRDIAVWTEQHDRRLAQKKAEDAREARVERVGQRLGVSASASYGRHVTVYEDDFFELAERLGVEID